MTTETIDNSTVTMPAYSGGAREVGPSTANLGLQAWGMNLPTAGSPSTEMQEEGGRQERVKAYLRRAGIGWLIVAGLQFTLFGFLDPSWGFVCLVLGVLNLAFPVRALMLVNGLALIGIGIMNCAHSAPGGGWSVFGMMQGFWGFKELVRFGKGDVAS
jgi:hypothetical protein